MTAQELLEFAAKAAGIQGDYLLYDGEEFRYGIVTEDKLWNPIENDSDAFRLMLDLNLTLTDAWINYENAPLAVVVVKNQESTVFCQHAKYDNPHQAARVAITRVAAMIGQTMK
jgi:hypothetical protein